MLNWFIFSHDFRGVNFLFLFFALEIWEWHHLSRFDASAKRAMEKKVNSFGFIFSTIYFNFCNRVPALQHFFIHSNETEFRERWRHQLQREKNVCFSFVSIFTRIGSHGSIDNVRFDNRNKATLRIRTVKSYLWETRTCCDEILARDVFLVRASNE